MTDSINFYSKTVETEFYQPKHLNKNQVTAKRECSPKNIHVFFSGNQKVAFHTNFYEE